LPQRESLDSASDANERQKSRDTGKLYRRYCEAAIPRLQDERRYRVFVHLERDIDSFPSAKWRRGGGSVEDVTVWRSNNQLGMGQQPGDEFA